MKVATCWYATGLFTGLFVVEELVSCGKGTPNRAQLRTNLPVIDSIVPSSGPVGTEVTIWGKNLGNSFTQVTVNGKTAAGATNGAGSAAAFTLSKAQFNRPAGIVMDAQGNFYVADAGNNRIRKMTSYKH